MKLMDGLATFEIFKTGFFIFIILIFFGFSIFLLINSIQKNYVSTTICNVVSNKDSSFTQTVTYTVNNDNYTQIIPANMKTVNNITKLSYAHPEGQCTLYYSKKDPKIYSVNSNPVKNNIIIVGVVLVIGVLVVLWFLFLRSNRQFAGIMGGIDIASSIFRR
jgi:hypothetical protein